MLEIHIIKSIFCNREPCNANFIIVLYIEKKPERREPVPKICLLEALLNCTKPPTHTIPLTFVSIAYSPDIIKIIAI